MPAILDLESLVEIIYELRLAGYDISTQQYIAAQNLLIALATRGELPDNPRALRTWLAPVICSSPREQENFYRYFDRWVVRHPELTTGTPKDQGKSPELSGAVDQPEWRWLRLLGRPWFQITETVLLLALGTLLLFYFSPRSRSLNGIVVDDKTNQSISGAKISFDNQETSSNQSGGFSFTYISRELPAILVVQNSGYETTSVRITTATKSSLTVRLLSAQPPPSTPTSEATPTPPRIPLLTSATLTPTVMWWQRRVGFGYAAVLLPLLMFGGWWLWKTKLNRALLQKLQQVKEPRLEQLTVKSAAAELFEGQSFRRTVQELRRHRQRGALDLDAERTIGCTIQNGGLFTPAYRSRQTLPEYLVLIDQVSFADQQARLDTEIVRRLVRDNVFVDAYYFQGDPRLCRRLQKTSRHVTLHEMAALHPDHHVLVFSDGASFINPLSGKPERWLDLFAVWPRRALLTPESSAQWGERERKLAELDFTILPATRGGLSAFAEILAGGVEPRLEGERRARPFPPIMRQDSKRWLENHEPTRARADKLCDQLKIFLGTRGYFWLSACAIYPMLYWELTLYLGFKLFRDRQEIEERLRALVRLPWFRYGSIPDWLRLRLISALSPDEEKSVRQALEDLFLTMLQFPADGLKLKIADRADNSRGWAERLKKRLAEWKFKRLFWQVLKNQPPESPLRDYVFLNFMSNRKPRKLTVSLPDTIRRLVFPQGQIVLGMRPVAALVLAIVFSLSVLFINLKVSGKTTTPPSARFYSEMSAADQDQFLRGRLSEILKSIGLGEKEVWDDGITPERLQSIKDYVNQYSSRIGNNSTQPGGEDLAFVFGRATTQIAPLINKAFRDRGMSPLLGLYGAMIESEFLQDAVEYPVPEKGGVFGLTTGDAPLLGLTPADRNDVAKVSRALAGFFASSRVILFDPKSEIDKGKLLAAAVIGENSRTFGLDMEPLSTYTTISAEYSMEIADLVGRLGGADRVVASDRLVRLYARDNAGVVSALINAIQADGSNSYRPNLYIARTLGLIKPAWDGTVDQIARVLSLQKSKDYQDPTFKLWVDRATAGFNRTGIIDCACAKVEFGLLTRPYQDECRKTEAELWQQINDTGKMIGVCNPVASGPNAKPSNPTPTPTPTPSPSPLREIVGIIATPQTVEVGQSVNFRAVAGAFVSGAVIDDALQTGVSYQFNFGDGSPAATQSNTQIAHQYSSPGVYLAFVIVRVQRGGTSVSKVSQKRIINVVNSSPAIVPNVIGKTESDARNIFNPIFNPKTEFELGKVTYVSDAREKGFVTGQQPGAGARMPYGTKIDIIVSLGSATGSDEELILVPNVLGTNLDEAEGILDKVGLKGVSDSPDYAGQAPLIVVSQDPAPGSIVKARSMIKLKACRNRDCK